MAAVVGVSHGRMLLSTHPIPDVQPSSTIAQVEIFGPVS
jgi:hypothetical protein